MESVQLITRRLKSVKNIKQITKAMELVAATKMRKSEEHALLSRPYRYAALDLLAKVVSLSHAKLPRLLEKREVKRTAYVVITSDKGLAGSFNSNVIKAIEAYLGEHQVDLANKEEVLAIGVGQKAIQYFERKGAGELKSFTRIADFTSPEEVLPLANTLIDGYLDHTVDRVLVFSAHFRSALRQDVLVRELLPVSLPALKKSADDVIPERGRFADLVKAHRFSLFEGRVEKDTEYLIEPSPETVLDELAAHLVFMDIYGIVLEANASEHAARRMAMQSASDNAGDLESGLTREYNKSRQAGITRELIEITAGAESLA
jgi:F-type H+-transporting ATPase subunit gamma